MFYSTRLKTLTIIFSMLVFSMHGFAQSIDYTNWMSELPDDTLLRNMSIPGTHDTMSRECVSPIPIKAALTQHQELEDQLNSGIRCLDIRVDLENVNSHVSLYHGGIAMIGNFKNSVHVVCQDFLRKNPREAIIMFIKHETGEGFRTSNKPRLKEFLQNIIEKSSSYIDCKKKPLHTLTLGDVRSKIILIDRSNLTYKGYKYDTTFKNPAADNKEQKVLNILDRYEYQHVDQGVRDTIESFKKEAEKFNDPDSAEYQRWPLTYISFTDEELNGPDPFTPEQAAEKMNPRFYRYLIDEFKERRVGTVLMDYPDKHSRTKLVGKIIAYNWKHPYLMEIKTADVRDAGTDANIMVTMHGEKAECLVNPKFGIGYDAYEKNALNSPVVHSAKDLGRIKAVTVHFEKGGRKSGWCLDHIKVTDLTNNTGPTLFDFKNQWFYSDGSKKVSASAYSPDKLAYEMRIKTSGKKDAGTDANITVQLNGTKDSYTFDPKKKGIPGDGFERNQTDYLSFLTDKEIGPLYNITVWFDAHGRKSGWCLEYIEVKTPYNNGEWVRFPFNPQDGGQWFYSANDKKVAYAAKDNPLTQPHTHKKNNKEIVVNFGQAGDIPLAFKNGKGQKDELCVFRTSDGFWYVKDLFARKWGMTTDIPMVFDFDGDGKSEFCVYRVGNGYWYNHNMNGLKEEKCWGKAGDIPVSSFDSNGDGKDDYCVFRPSNGNWYVLGDQVCINGVDWGQAGDVPVSFDHNGDGKSEYCVFRPSDGNWYFLDVNKKQYTTINWGTAGDIPLSFVHGRDGKSDCCVWRPSNGTFYVKNGPTVQLGSSGDIPVSLDYNGDGRTDFCVWCPVTGNWHIILNT